MCWLLAKLPGAVGVPVVVPMGCQGKARQPGPVPPPQPGVRQSGDTEAAPGIGCLPGDRDKLRPGWDVACGWMGRAGLW